MIRQLVDVVVLAALFLLAAEGLNRIGFWSFAGLREPHGFVTQGLLFLALLFTLQTFLFGPYLKVLEERHAQTAGKKEAAERTRKEADAMIERYRDAIEEARLRAVRERERRALAAEEEERTQIAKAKDEGNQRFSATVRDVERDEQKARAELEASIGTLAEEIARQVMTRNNPRRRPMRMAAGGAPGAENT